MSDELTTMAAAALADPVRQELLAFVSRHREAVAPDEAAEALGIPVSTAAFHLARLVEAGFITPEFGRRSGRDDPIEGGSQTLYRAMGRGVAESAIASPRPRTGR